MLDLLRARELNTEHADERVRRHVHRLAQDFGLTPTEVAGVPAVASPHGLMAVLHAFEDPNPDSRATRVQRVRAACPAALLTSVFEVVRRPGRVVGHLLSG